MQWVSLFGIFGEPWHFKDVSGAEFSSCTKAMLRFSGSTQLIFRRILGIIQNHANISTIQEVGNSWPTPLKIVWVLVFCLGWCKGICSFRNLGILRILWEWCWVRYKKHQKTVVQERWLLGFLYFLSGRSSWNKSGLGLEHMFQSNRGHKSPV